MTASPRDLPARVRPWHRRREPAAAHLPGDFAMWVMVLGDIFFFGCYFVTYMGFRARSAEEFTNAQRHLDMAIGVTNTIVLLTSSMFVALAVTAARHRAARTAERLVWAAAGCGVAFVLLKVAEWHEEISHGYTVSNEFFSFYFVLTGIHLAHLLLGLLVLGVVVRELRHPDRQRPHMVEQGAVYWHMVDLLWVVIFAILYLMR